MILTKDDWWFGTRFFPCIGNVIIRIDSYFSEGWLNHQPENVDEFTTFFVLEMTLELYAFFFSLSPEVLPEPTAEYRYLEYKRIYRRRAV